MELINSTDFQTVTGQQNQPPPTLSKTEAIANPISLEKQTAMGDVIDRWRLNKGWSPLDNESQDLAILSWVNVLDSENIPASTYNELFVRALKLRASLFAQGKQPPDMGIELMLSCWESLSKEIEQRRIDAQKFLPETAASGCPRCYGTNRENIFDEKSGRVIGVKANCDHRPLVHGEYLWRKVQLKKE